MYNIISNSCVGATITLDVFKQPYINPFCWSIVRSDSFSVLIREYASINFESFILERDDSRNRYSVIIDNKVRVYYEHYIESPEHETIFKCDNNILYANIRQYIIDKYTNRLHMNATPLFIIGNTWDINVDKRVAYENIILSNECKYPLIVVVNTAAEYEHLKQYECTHVKVHRTELFRDNRKLAFDIHASYSEMFLACDDGIPYDALTPAPYSSTRIE